MFCHHSNRVIFTSISEHCIPDSTQAFISVTLTHFDSLKIKKSCRISALTNLKVENKHAHLPVITEAEYFSRSHHKIDSPNRTQHLPADILLLLCPSLYTRPPWLAADTGFIYCWFWDFYIILAIMINVTRVPKWVEAWPLHDFLKHRVKHTLILY